MKVKWLGHSAFLITTSGGTKILTDPYKPASFDGAVGYAPISEAVDIVTVSHEHDDHNGVEDLPGEFRVFRGAGEHSVPGVRIRGVTSYHDGRKGSERGQNTIFVIEADGIRVCHLGDLGHSLTAADAKRIGDVDVLLVPVGGHFTIDAKQAAAAVDVLGAKVVIPMHFKTESIGFPIAPVDGFLKVMGSFERPEASEVEITPESLLEKKRVVVLEHAL